MGSRRRARVRDCRDGGHARPRPPAPVNRSPAEHPPGDQAHQGEVKPRPARGVPVAQEPYTDALDEQLLRVDRGKCTARAGEEIHRETEGGLADGTRV